MIADKQQPADQILQLAMMAEECTRKSEYWRVNKSEHMAEYFMSQGQAYINRALRVAERAGL